MGQPKIHPHKDCGGGGAFLVVRQIGVRDWSRWNTPGGKRDASRALAVSRRRIRCSRPC
jgi:hypothetical protein